MRFIKLGLFSIFVAGFLAACSSDSNRRISNPPRATPVDIANTPNATPRHEPRSRYGNPKSYVVFGERYYLLDSAQGFRERGVASWYGPNFHGKKTSSGEIYDMNKMTAAHKTLPIPCYVEVTNLKNGRSIIVRVNDRGPFHDDRIIDLSFVAASKLDIIRTGTANVEIRVIDPKNPQAHRQAQLKAASSSTPIAERPITPRPVATTARPSVSTSNTTTAQTKRLPRSTPSHLQYETDATEKKLYVQIGAFSERSNALKLGHQAYASTQQAVSIIELVVEGKTIYKVRVGPIEDKAAVSKVIYDLNQAGHYDQNIVFQ